MIGRTVKSEEHFPDLTTGPVCAEGLEARFATSILHQYVGYRTAHPVHVGDEQVLAVSSSKGALVAVFVWDTQVVDHAWTQGKLFWPHIVMP